MNSRTRRSASDRRAGRGPRLWIGVLLAVPLTLSVVPVVAAAPDGDTLLDRVRSVWRGYRSLTARFEQTQQFAGFDEPLQSRGVLRILRPSFFDLRFDPPNRQRQICDGTWVWTYMEDQKQVFKAPLGRDATRSADLLDWATEGAVAMAVVADSSFAPGSLRLDLKPGTNLPLRELRLWVRATDAVLLCYEAIDVEGNRTRMRIVDLRRDKGLKSDQFRFVPPPGTEVIELGNEP
jgi:outer membrane lipoprotein carrier protein